MLQGFLVRKMEALGTAKTVKAILIAQVLINYVYLIDVCNVLMILIVLKILVSLNVGVQAVLNA